jgi:hypothetical protein
VLRHTGAMSFANSLRRRSLGPALCGVLIGLALSGCRMDPADDQSPPAGGAAAQVSIGLVQWYVDYGVALDIAREQGKPLWVHFGEHPG